MPLASRDPLSAPLRLCCWRCALRRFGDRYSFRFFALDLLRGDAILVGTLLDATRSGYTWHDNIIETQGHGIEIYGNCSSFHNVSLSILCWVTLTKLSRPNWISSDFIFGAAVCVVMIALNVARLYVAALN